MLPAGRPAARDADPNPVIRRGNSDEVVSAWFGQRRGADSMKHFRAEAGIAGRVQGTASTIR